MNSRIRTNKIEYSINRTLLSAKYDFYRIETSEKYIKGGAYILDAPSLDDSIKSIRFESGRNAIIMMLHNDNNRMVLKNLISSVDGGNSLSVEECSINDFQDNLLLQLLLNALSSYDSDILKFNNLTGHFYCFHPEWLKHGKDKSEDIIWKVPCLEFSFTPDYCIKMDVRTFTSERLKNKITFKKRKFEDYPKYIFSKDNTLRRCLSGEKETGFILRQTDGTKSEIPFLDFQNEKKFEQCKVGTLSRVISAFNKKYDSLAHIECAFETVTDRIDYSKRAARENEKIIKDYLNEYGVNIVDEIGDDYSKTFCKDIKVLLADKYGIDASEGKRVKKDSLNICVIHNAEYYDGSVDPHERDYSGVAVQHVTLEDFAGNAEFAISTVIHEVLIKKDLVERKITLFDWTQIVLSEDISFGTEVETDDGNKYYFMKVHPDGTFEISEQELNLFAMNEYTDCVNIFEDARLESETVKGIIRDSKGNINIIKDTGIITLPEAEEIKTLLSEGDTKLRGKERREELLSSCLDIKTFMDGNELYYFVGTIGEGMRWNIPRAANVRRIEGYRGTRLMFDKLLPTMNVTFVHNGQLTVVPFPFKYLREYVKRIFVKEKTN